MSNLRVIVYKVWGGSHLSAVAVSVRNYEEDTTMRVRTFPVEDPTEDDTVYQDAYRWSHRLAATLGCDHQEVV